jgi:hypothetical protein
VVDIAQLEYAESTKFLGQVTEPDALRRDCQAATDSMRRLTAASGLASGETILNLRRT